MFMIWSKPFWDMQHIANYAINCKCLNNQLRVALLMKHIRTMILIDDFKNRDRLCTKKIPLQSGKAFEPDIAHRM